MQKNKSKSKISNSIKKALKESQNMLSIVINNVPQYIFWKDKNFVFLGCNENFANTIGINSPSDIVGKTDYDLIDNGKADHFREIDKQIINKNKPIYNMLECHESTNGKTIWVNINKMPLHDSNNNIIGILGTFSDVTEQVYMNKKLQQSETKYRNLIEFTNTAYIIMDMDLRILETNKNFADLIHVSSLDSLIGRNPRSWVFVNDIPKFDNHFNKLLSGHPTHDIEINFVNNKGKLIYLSLTTGIIENGNKKIFTLLRDISYKKIDIDSKRIHEQKKKDKLIQAVRKIRNKIKNIKG